MQGDVILGSLSFPPLLDCTSSISFCSVLEHKVTRIYSADRSAILGHVVAYFPVRLDKVKSWEMWFKGSCVTWLYDLFSPVTPLWLQLPLFPWLKCQPYIRRLRGFWGLTSASRHDEKPLTCSKPYFSFKGSLSNIQEVIKVLTAHFLLVWFIMLHQLPFLSPSWRLKWTWWKGLISSISLLHPIWAHSYFTWQSLGLLW